MFGHDSKPTRILSYGSSPPTNEQAVLDQMRLAANYRNDLVRLERERRQRVDADVRDLAPHIIVVEAMLTSNQKKIDEAEARASEANSRERKRGSASTGARKHLASLRAERKRLRNERKELRKALFDTEEWKSRQKSINEWNSSEACRIRSEIVEKGLFWGTYVSVEHAAKSMRSGAPPDFKGWKGDGRIVVQLQKGLLVSDLRQGGKKTKKGKRSPNGMLQFEEKPEGVWARGTRKPAPGSGVRVDSDGFAMRKLGNAIARLRIGSDGRKPVWAEVPFHLHQPLPDDASVKWAWLIRKRVGSHYDWSIQFSVAKDNEDDWRKTDLAASGTVGIDLGWRIVEDRDHAGAKQIRVATWVGSDGQSGEIRLPGKSGVVRSLSWNYDKPPLPGAPSWIPWHEGYRKTEELQALRDDRFNEARESLVEWLRFSGVPDWMRKCLTKPGSERDLTAPEVVARIVKWRAPRRLAMLSLRWRSNRVAGDEVILQTLEKWRARDKHFLCWASHQRDQLQKQRLDCYRAEIRGLARRYATFVIEGRSKKEKEADRPMDLRAFHKLPTPEAKAGVVGEKGSRAKEYVRYACLSSLRMCIKEAARNVVVVPSPGTSSRCSACGFKMKLNGELVHTCSNCGVKWDRDENAAKNLLNAAVAATTACER